MRLGGLVVVWAAVASAQTHVEGSGVAGVTLSSHGAVSAQSAADVRLERSLASTVAVSAHLAVQLLTSPTGVFSFSDLSSSVQIRFRLPSWDTTAICLEVFPLDGRRVRPSFDAANTWGAPLRPLSVAPVFKVSAVHGGASIWGAVQGYQQLDNASQELAMRWTGLLGGGVALPMGLRSELILAAEDRGDIPIRALQGLPSSVLAGGGAARFGWDTGGGVVSTFDPASFAADPDRFSRFFARDRYDLPLAASASIEAGVASQNLSDPDVLDGVRRDATGYLDLQGRLRLAGLRLFLTLRFRNVGLVNFDGPGTPNYVAFQRAAATQDEYSGLVGGDLRFGKAGLTPGLAMRLVRPATLKSPVAVPGGNAPPTPVEARVVVIEGLNQFEILPTGQPVSPRFEVIGSLRFDYFAALSALLFVHYTLDPNRTVFRDSATGVAEPTRFLSDGVNVQLLVQVTF